MRFAFPGVVLLIGTLLAFALAYHLTFREQLLKNIFAEPKRYLVVIAAGFSLIAVGFQSVAFVEVITTRFLVAIHRVLGQIGIPAEWHKTVLHIGGYGLYLTTAFAFFVFLYAFFDRFVPFIVDVFKESDHIERWYVAIVFLTAVIAVGIVFNQTNAFYCPLDANGKIIVFDAVYVADSGEFYQMNVYGSIAARENDIRQPLFGLFAMPFAISATFLSAILFFVPNAYIVILQVLQVALLGISITLMSRMLRLSGWSKTFFLLLFTLSYPLLLFSLMMEQYQIAVFYLIVFLYSVLHKKSNQDYMFIASLGTLMTAAVLFPLLTFSKDIRRWFLNCRDIAYKYSVLLIISGFFKEFFQDTSHLLKFTGVKLSFYDKFLQFVNYISLCFITPSTTIGYHSEKFKKIIEILGWNSAKNLDFQTYQLVPVTSLNLLGVILLAVAVLGFVLNWKEPFARICGFWVLFSFFVLCLVGWGTAENGLILYSLYFGWAYFCLVFLAIEKALQKLPLVKYGVYAAATITLAAINLPGIWDVIQFGIQYYPVK